MDNIGKNLLLHHFPGPQTSLTQLHVREICSQHETLLEKKDRFIGALLAL